MDAGEWTTQMRRGVLEFCILRILQRGPSYGYEIVSRLEPLGPLAAGENTVYPILRRLKSERVLETFLKPSPAGPPRQYYRLTPTGQKRLALLTTAWEAVVRAVQHCADREPDS